jgi:dipeptidase
MGETLAYRVTDIYTVLPEDTGKLTIDARRDLCTLVTCTPYGVNSHRLLIRGERTEYEEAVSVIEDAEFTPESDNIPWAMVPDRKIDAAGVAYLLSTHYEGTPYNPYSGQDTGKRGIYRSIGINRTGVAAICQIRPYAPDPIKGVEWVSFGSTTFSAWLPVYTNAPAMPDYLSKVTLDVSTENFYWSSRLIGALADKCYAASAQNIERYQNAVAVRARQLIREYDRKMADTGDFSLTKEANEKLCVLCREETSAVLNKVLQTASEAMKNGFNLADN